jgi:diguanylate cyclase (GGDEF)-like protein
MEKNVPGGGLRKLPGDPGTVLIVRPLWPVMRRVAAFLSAEGYLVEETSSWSRLLESQLSCGELAGILLGDHGPADEEAEIVRRFREREGSAGVPVVLIGGMNAIMRTAKFRSSGVDLVLPADTTPELLLERVSPLLRYGSIYRSLRDSNRSLREQAMLDSLTGLPNRKRFSLDAARHVEMARRIGRPLSCIISDIDDFRRINEMYGRETGDSVIRQFGIILDRARRVYDSIARLGGDEFAWLLVDADREKAFRAAERAQAAIRDNVFDSLPEPIRLTATFGISTASPGTELSVERLVGNADRALYWGKESGKNVVRFYPAKKANTVAEADTYIS